MMIRSLAAALIAPLVLAACATTTTTAPGEPQLIARATDSALVNRGPLTEQHPALAVLPDGCQVWVIDDGAEGYAGDRSDPKSGLPVCNDRLRKGAVYGEYTSNAFPDILP